MTPEELRERTAEFAKRVAVFTGPLLTAVHGCHEARQLRRAASAIGANYRAAGCARSRAEFTAKIGLVVEEADESCFWLMHLLASGIVSETAERAALAAEARELVKIFAKSYSTASRGSASQHRNRPRPPRHRTRPE